MENYLEYILCHGSSNRFAMIDLTMQSGSLEEFNLPQLSRVICRDHSLDGLLVATRDSGLYAMRMFNTDGSEAEMCGNGIRCIARLIDQRYLSTEHFTLRSGGRYYPITREMELFEGIPTYGVEIGIEKRSRDLGIDCQEFILERIPELNDNLRFSFLSLGNPHIVAIVEQIDYSLLTFLGERVKSVKEIFPNGVNVSLLKKVNEREIFVATYERGVGLTSSCGTAMTASTTVAALVGVVPSGCDIRVSNRGGMVRCNVAINGDKISTRLVGNATFESIGTLSWNGSGIEYISSHSQDKEIESYAKFVANLNKKNE